MSTTTLDGEWTLTAVRGPIPDDITGRRVPAVVPGCAHTDLHRAGLIADPFDGDNETTQQWIGSTVWRYEREFAWQPDGSTRYDLVADGLDTLATVTVNGAVVATTANQHRSYRFEIGHLLTPGANMIAVEFDAPVDAAERVAAAHGGALPHVNHHPYNSLRKTASNFGWDWGIDVATSGIWKPIAIEGWSDVRIAAVRPLVDVIGDEGVLTAHIDLERLAAGAVDATLTVSRDGVVVAEAAGRIAESGAVRVVVPDVALWWPTGHGEQSLYDVVVTVGDAAWQGRVGFRTVTLDTSGDEHGTRFVVHVNGRPIWIRGANWIPDHAFATEITPERLGRRIDDALDAHINLLRVWGGGMYESEHFYRLCDERGLLVWQDFLFACAAYAEEDWLAGEVEAEVREAVTRLSRHPSLILWNGNNENIVAYAEWGWRSAIGDRTWGNGYYRRLLPAIVAELDPTRPYTPGSPYSFAEYVTPNDDHNGSVHIWDVWNEKDYTAYREWKPRFVAEFGFQGPPAWTTLTSVVHDEPLDPYGPQMLVHQKADRGNLKLERGYTGHFPAPTSIDDWHFTTQLNQAHAIRYGIEYFRSLAPYNTGTVVWQLNDDWPVVSWAAVDFAERRKPLWYALRDAYRPRLVTIQPDDDVLQVVIVNDTDEAIAAPLRLERLSFDGAVQASGSVEVAVAARSVWRGAVAEQVAAVHDAAAEIVVATLGEAERGERAIWNFAEIVDQSLTADAVEASAEETADGARITVTATAYVRGLTVLADRADATASVDASVVDLLPGESTVFELRGAAPIPAEAALSPLVLRHANQLVAAARAGSA